MKKTVIFIFAVLALVFCFAACNKEETETDNNDGSGSNNNSEFSFTETEEATNYVKLEMKNGGIIIIELYPDEAPITVRNFKELVSRKYYDNLIFHRVIEGFMIQGGRGATEVETIKGEFAANGVTNNIKHERGVISMARTSISNDSATSQFFICHKTENCRHLDGQYAAFGRVISGIEIVDEIAATETDIYDMPVKEQRIKTIRFVSISDKENGSDTGENSVNSDTAVSQTADSEK